MELGGGRWAVGGGRWAVGGGRWAVGGGRWAVADGTHPIFAAKEGSQYVEVIQIFQLLFVSLDMKTDLWCGSDGQVACSCSA